MTFREALRKLIVDKDISLKELAEKAGIKYQTAKGYTSKSAKRKPSVPHLIAICRALDVSLDTFKDCEDLQNEKDEPGSTSEESAEN